MPLWLPVCFSDERTEFSQILLIVIHVIHRIIPDCVHSCPLDTARTIASTLHAFKFELMNLTLRTMTHFTFSGVVSKHMLLNQRLPLEMIILFDSHGRRFLFERFMKVDSVYRGGSLTTTAANKPIIAAENNAVT